MKKKKSIFIDEEQVKKGIYALMIDICDNKMDSLFIDYLHHYGINKDNPGTYTIHDLYNAIIAFPLKEIVQGETFCIYVKGESFGSLEMITGIDADHCFSKVEKDYAELKDLAIDRFVYPFNDTEYPIKKNMNNYPEIRAKSIAQWKEKSLSLYQ